MLTPVAVSRPTGSIAEKSQPYELNNTSTLTKKPALEPSDPLGVRFCKYFNHGWDFIIAPTPAPGSRPAWKTENRYPLEPRNLWGLHQNPNYLIGLRFGKRAKYAAIDIDSYSSHHPDNDTDKYREVLAAMESIGLCRHVPLRSSESGGLHLYLPLPKSVGTFNLACAIKFALFDHCIELKSGQVEAFPNTKPYGQDGKFTLYNGLRLPLQTGSYLLDEDLQPYSDSVGDLLDTFDWAAGGQDLQQLTQAMSAGRLRQKLFNWPGSSGRAELWRRHLEERWMQGWTGSGQTNSLLKDIACYGRVWMALDGRALVDYTVATATSAPGYDQFCRHQREIRQRAVDWSRCVEAYYWPYGTEPSRQGTYAEHFHRDYDNDCPDPKNNIVELPSNDKRSTQAEERIRQAVAHLESSSSLPSTATARSYAIIAAALQLTGTGISQTTLHKPKYLPLWHPNHYFPQAELDVIDCPEPIPAVDDSPKTPQTPSNTEQAETLSPAPVLESGSNYTSAPYMKGLCVLSGTAPQGQSCPAEFLGGESEGGEASAAPTVEPVKSLQAESADPEVSATDLLPLVVFLVAALAELKQDAASVLETAAPVAGTAPMENPQAPSAPPEVPDDAELKQNAAPVLETAAFVAGAAPLPEVTTAWGIPPNPVLPEATTPLPEATAPLPQAAPVAPVDFRRIARIRVEARPYAEKAVRIQEQLESSRFSTQERERRITIAKMRFLWESGEPTLMREVTEWAHANPDALPEALPLDGLAGAGVAAAALEEHADTADTNNADSNADSNADMESEPTAEELELEAYYLDYLETPNPADFECPCEDSQPDPES